MARLQHPATIGCSDNNQRGTFTSSWRRCCTLLKLASDVAYDALWRVFLLGNRRLPLPSGFPISLAHDAADDARRWTLFSRDGWLTSWRSHRSISKRVHLVISCRIGSPLRYIRGPTGERWCLGMSRVVRCEKSTSASGCQRLRGEWRRALRRHA